MAKSIYVSQNGIARKGKKMYVGINNVSKKGLKAYIGDKNNIARLFFSAEQIIEFISCPFPTSWTTINVYKYEATNDYGTWSLDSTTFNGNAPNWYVKNAFDKDTSTSYCSSSLSSTATATIYIYSPVLINPTKIYILYYQVGGKSTIEGYNPETENWEKLATLTSTGMANKESTFSISGNTFYSAFRVVLYRYSSSYKMAMVKEFQITEGIIKS